MTDADVGIGTATAQAPSGLSDAEVGLSVDWQEPKGLSDADVGLAAPSDIPKTDSALAAMGKGVMDVAKGIPEMPMQFLKGAYQAAKFVTGTPEQKTQVAAEALKEAIPQGQQLAKDVQSPLGTRESTRGLLQLGMMAATALDFLRPAEGIKPPIQEGVSDAIPRSDAQIQARDTTLGEQTRPESEVPKPSDSDNVVRETQGDTRTEPVSTVESVAPPVQTQPNAPRSLVADLPESGISTERLQAIYGDDAVIINKGKSAEQWKAIGEDDKRDPYEVLTKARRSGIVGPKDTPLLRAEHQKLLDNARNAYGTPAYPQLAKYAADFANAIKTVAHGPAHDIFMQLQEADKPNYTSPADFDNIMRERMQRESTPEEQKTFTKVTDEVKNGDTEVKQEATKARTNLKRYMPKEPMKFSDAADFVRKQIKELTDPCEL